MFRFPAKRVAASVLAVATLMLFVPEQAEAGRYRRAVRRAYRPVVVAPARVVAPRVAVGYRGFYGGGVRVAAPGVGVYVGW